MRDRLIELTKASLIRHIDKTCKLAENITDDLLANGVIVPPCKVGDTVYYLNTRPHMALYSNRIYEAKVTRIVITSLGIATVILIKDESGCCEVPDIKDFGKTVFLTREDAEKALAERNAKCQEEQK